MICLNLCQWFIAAIRDMNTTSGRNRQKMKTNNDIRTIRIAFVLKGKWVYIYYLACNVRLSVFMTQHIVCPKKSLRLFMAVVLFQTVAKHVWLVYSKEWYFLFNDFVMIIPFMNTPRNLTQFVFAIIVLVSFMISFIFENSI
jgi:hypothetical protein